MKPWYASGAAEIINHMVLCASLFLFSFYFFFYREHSGNSHSSRCGVCRIGRTVSTILISEGLCQRYQSYHSPVLQFLLGVCGSTSAKSFRNERTKRGRRSEPKRPNLELLLSFPLPLIYTFIRPAPHTPHTLFISILFISVIFRETRNRARANYVLLGSLGKFCPWETLLKRKEPVRTANFDP